MRGFFASLRMTGVPWQELRQPQRQILTDDKQRDRKTTTTAAKATATAAAKAKYRDLSTALLTMRP
jgi:hypothetical protein